MRHLIRQYMLAVLVFGVIFVISGCSGFRQAEIPAESGVPENDKWPVPIHVKAGEDPLEPGLSVVYYNKKIRHIGSMPDPETMKKKGFRGEPIVLIAHRFGEGEVFGSGASRGICVQMTGFLEFDKPGSYQLKANSNDGIRIYLDRKKILDDPDVHSDRFTPPASLEISKTGRYPLLLRYFQRKGTATLELYWKEPGADQFTIIPGTAYSHKAVSP